MLGDSYETPPTPGNKIQPSQHYVNNLAGSDVPTLKYDMEQCLKTCTPKRKKAIKSNDNTAGNGRS